MATYNISSLLSRLAEIKQDGYSFVDITELSADDEFPESLHFDALDEFETVDYEEIESIDLDIFQTVLQTAIRSMICVVLCFSPTKSLVSLKTLYQIHFNSLNKNPRMIHILLKKNAK